MKLSLEGKKVLVTRARHQASSLATRLQELGAIPILLPAIEIAEPHDLRVMDDALRHLDDFDWVVFTSVNGVHMARKRMDALGLSPEKLSSKKIAAVGPTTFELIAEAWHAPDVMPKDYTAEALAACLGDMSGQSVLMLRADKARDELPEKLAESGATVLDIIAYRTVPVTEPAGLSEDERPDTITLSSGESAKATIVNLREGGLEDWLEQIPIVCIGPITAGVLRDEGLTPAAVASPHTIEGLVNSICKLFEHAEEKEHAMTGSPS